MKAPLYRKGISLDVSQTRLSDVSQTRLSIEADADAPLNSTLSRRSFLKGTTLSAVALALGNDRAHSFSSIDNENSPPRRTRIPTVCSMCKASCLVQATVSGGRLLKIKGNPANPRNGRLICARGQAAVKLLDDPDRLKFPLKRVGRRGEGKWKRISWSEALTTIAAQIKKNLTIHGPDSLALLAGGSSSYYIKKLYQEKGVSRIYDALQSQCETIRDQAYQATFGCPGTALNLDYSRSQCLLLIGSHLGENVQVPELRNVLSALQNGTELIVVDPRYSAIAAKAGQYLPVKPGTDTALILGWLHHIVFGELYDEQWVSEHVIGFEELKEHLRDYPLHKVAQITGIPATEISRAAETMAYHAPATIVHPGGHLSWYGNDVQRVRAQAILAAVLGAVDQPGGMQLPLKSKVPQELADFADTVSLSTPSFSSLREDIIARKVKVVGCWGQNPFQNHPSPYKTIEAFQEAEFVYCTDILPGEACLYADVILPEATFLERLDIIEVWNEKRPLIASRFPVVAPRFETKDPYWIVAQLARQLGGRTLFGNSDVSSFLDQRLQSAGTTLANLKSSGGFKLLDLADPLADIDPFADLDLGDLPGGVESQASKPPLYGTASGKIELYSSDFAMLGFGGLPDYEKVKEPPRGFIRLLYGRSPVHTLTSTTNNPWLRHEMGENEIWINDTYAARLSLTHGETVFLENQDGIRSIKRVKVKVTPGIRTDCGYMVHGFGCRSSHLKEGFHQGISDTSLMTRSSTDPISGVRGMRVNFVRVVKS